MEDNLEQFHTEAIPDAMEPEEKRSGFLRFVMDVLETLILSVILFAGINAISARIRVDGSSMEPSLHSGEFVIVSKLSYKIGSPHIGDVIVFHFPRDPEQEYIKRVIGLPGDHVEVKNGSVYVNGQRLDENYIAADPAYNITRDVPEDALFVLGDNRNNSSDSHNWGPVPLDFVVGKAIFVYWPPTNWGVIEHPAIAVAAP
ncbi:MAG TPA: signal peptidase I [Anaerolineales bacterium]|jgi:signal peptidase I|nr:signal peptidase I [Anaerolineales bacterium]